MKGTLESQENRAHIVCELSIKRRSVASFSHINCRHQFRSKPHVGNRLQCFYVTEDRFSLGFRVFYSFSLKSFVLYRYKYERKEKYAAVGGEM